MVKKKDEVMILRGPKTGTAGQVLEVLGDGIKVRTSSGEILGNVRHGHYKKIQK